ncbi:Transposase [Desulforamulus putei DSM 12395]|uniref:Transposase n=3 Tax=Desulforamulus putei DSM 12395 TaxID=1121429 RepID=A0A1M5DL09_9FIRM|nr:IS110 family transposase [Desulforamulus putei]SHF67452.1 Transposase [Desulforamulus putei DSM 12395]
MKVSKIKQIQPNTLIVGIDIAKQTHWAQMMLQGKLIGKAFSFQNTRESFENLVTTLKAYQQKLGATNIVVGMEPTGHYFKPLAYYLHGTGMCEVVIVNPYHVNRSKEFDDNSPSKNDRKDARLIAKLISQGTYFNLPLIFNIWAELRTANVSRMQLTQKRWQLKCQLITILDQYFPEFPEVFKNVLGKGAMYVLTHCPFPDNILELGEQTLSEGLRGATHNRVGQKRAQKLWEAAQNSIGIKEGVRGARLQLAHLVEELNLIHKQLEETEEMMSQLLKQTGLGDYLTSIPGVGMVTAAAFLAEIGNPDEYESYKQIQKKAGLNLRENSSGKHKGKTTISKRGRPALRQLMYQIAYVSVAKNAEMKAFYEYLKNRKENPLAGKQALIAVAVKMMKVMLAVCKNRSNYDGGKVGNQNLVVRMQAA